MRFVLPPFGLLCLAACLLASCGSGQASPAVPRLADASGVDPLVKTSVELAVASCERREPGALFELALTYDANALDELAASTYRLCLEDAELSGARQGILYLLAGTLEQCGRREEAVAALEEVRALAPDYAPVHWRLGQLLEQAGRAAEAKLAFERALQLDPASVPQDPWTAEMQKRATGLTVALDQANQLLAKGDARAALAMLEPLYAARPGEVALVELLAKALLDAGELDRAAQLIERARSSHPGRARLELYAGQVALGKKDLPLAKRLLESSLALDSSHGPTYRVLGEVELRLGALPAAEAAFDRAVEKGVADLRTRVLLAQVEIQLGKLERACTLLEGLRTEFPGNVVPLAHLAEAYARRGDAPKAREVLGEAERIDAKFGYLAKVRELVGGLESTPR